MKKRAEILLAAMAGFLAKNVPGVEGSGCQGCRFGGGGWVFNAQVVAEGAGR